MKTISLAFFLFLTVHVFGQFPAPTNFTYRLAYTNQRPCYNCCSLPENGTYCSNFLWNAPDTTSIISTLSHYNIYYRPVGTQSSTVIATSTVLSKSFYFGPTGDMWITAVYSNPSGESNPSNICTNLGLPIEVPIVKQTDKIKIQFDNAVQVLRLQSTISLTKLNLINTDGKTIKEFDNPDTELKLTELPRGFYVVEIYTSENEVFRQKIMK